MSRRNSRININNIRYNNNNNINFNINNGAVGMEVDGEVKENVSPQRRGVGGMRGRQEASPETSPARSCVSSEDGLKYSSSPETTSMMLVGCPRCLMYVMLSDVDPRCPKCKSTVLLDLHQYNDHNNDNDDDDDMI